MATNDHDHEGRSSDLRRRVRAWGAQTAILGCLGLLVVVTALIGLGVVRLVSLSPSTTLADSRRLPPPQPPVPAIAPGAGEARPALLDCTGAAGASAAAVKQAQAAWAQYLGRRVVEEDEIAPGVKMAFVLVPPGKFLMGSPADEEGHDADETLHEVTLTEPFDLGQTEVTQAQYQAVIGKNPSHFKGTDLPVETVDWYDTMSFASSLTYKPGAKHKYRLPTEAEWEYACRGGRPSSQPFGVRDGRALSSREANFNGNHPYDGADKGPFLGATCRVGSYPLNAFGLFDMQGNVWEWWDDWYGPYPRGNVTNPTGPSDGSYRVIRGGSWSSGARGCRAALRSRDEWGSRSYNVGFRLARSVPSGSNR